MWLSLICIVLILAIAYYQATQGLFSAVIMMLLTICCAAAALGTFEWVAVQWLAPLWKPDLAHPIALGVVFGVPLLILRLVFDRLIRRACLLPAWVERIGGGICGLITAVTIVGMMALSVQMIPFGESALGFSRFDVADFQQPDATPPPQHTEERGLWLNPDGFAVTVASLLSNGVFSGPRRLHEVYPDLAQAFGWGNFAHRDVSRYAPPRSIAVREARPVRYVYRFKPGREGRNPQPPEWEPLEPQPGRMFQMVRVKLENAARDAQQNHAFTLRQFRLVGRRQPEGAYDQFHPIAIQQSEKPTGAERHERQRVDHRGTWPVTETPFAPRDQSNEIELVFSVPTGFDPVFVEYKRSARAAVSFGPPSQPGEERASREPVAEPPSQPPPTPTPSETRRGRRGEGPAPSGGSEERAEAVPDSGRGGRVRGLTTLPGRSFFGEQLPVSLRSYQQLRNVEISSGVLKGGHLLAEVTEQDEDRNPPVSRFEVPSDKRLLHLNVGTLQAGSAFGRALSQAIAVVQNYFVEDDAGRQYKIIGKYALADVRGEKLFEVQYFPEQAGTMGGLGDFRRIDESELGADDGLVLLFLVEPGARIVSFSTGGAATRRDDLRGENLVAPR